MNVSLTERQRAALFLRLVSVGDWGGNEETLMLRASVWEKLKLASFEKLGDKINVSKLGTKAQPHTLSRAEAEHIVRTVSAGLDKGLDFTLALEFATIVRAVRAAFPKAKAPEPPP